MTDARTSRTIAALWRIESPKLMAGLVRRFGDVGLAEDLAQEAFLAAFATWPSAGIPEKPGAWLMATARNRALDLFRRNATLAEKHQELARELLVQEEAATTAFDAVLTPAIPDDMLRLMLIACHPILPREGRVALTLRMVGGLTTDEIARAFLLPEPTVAQRIVRAKRKLGVAGLPFEVPEGEDLARRVGSVLEVLYLVFNEGYAATAGDDWMRPGLCEDALRLGRVLAGLVPDQPEVHGLVALMAIQASRTAARLGANGEPVLLLDQDRTRWNRLYIQLGLASLARAEALGGADGPYALQAAVAACHARAVRAEETDWRRIVALYDRLAVAMPSPIVALNRAVAVAMAEGPAAGLACLDALLGEPALQGYHLLPSARADFLMKLGRHAEASAEFERAAGMTRNARERALLLARASAAAAVDAQDRLLVLDATRALRVEADGRVSVLLTGLGGRAGYIAAGEGDEVWVVDTYTWDSHYTLHHVGGQGASAVRVELPGGLLLWGFGRDRQGRLIGHLQAGGPYGQAQKPSNQGAVVLDPVTGQPSPLAEIPEGGDCTVDSRGYVYYGNGDGSWSVLIDGKARPLHAAPPPGLMAYDEQTETLFTSSYYQIFASRPGGANQAIAGTGERPKDQ